MHAANAASSLSVIRRLDGTQVLEHSELQGLSPAHINLTCLKKRPSDEKVAQAYSKGIVYVYDSRSNRTYSIDRNEIELLFPLSTEPLSPAARFNEIAKKLDQIAKNFKIARQSGAGNFHWKDPLLRTIINIQGYGPIGVQNYTRRIRKSADNAFIGLFFTPKNNTYMKLETTLSRGTKIVQDTLDIRTNTIFVRVRPNLKGADTRRKSNDRKRQWVVEREIYENHYQNRNHLKWLMVPHEIVCYKTFEGAGDDDVKFQLILEKFPNDLLNLVNDRGLSPDQKITISRYVIKAILEFRRVNGKYHGDLKLDNFLVSLIKGIRVKLIDYSFATANETSREFSGAINYVVPEILTGRPINARMKESWQAGLLLYAIATSSLPDFQTALYNNENYRPLLAEFHAEKHGLPFENVMKALLKDNPQNRIDVEEADRLMDVEFKSL